MSLIGAPEQPDVVPPATELDALAVLDAELEQPAEKARTAEAPSKTPALVFLDQVTALLLAALPTSLTVAPFGHPADVPL